MLYLAKTSLLESAIINFQRQSR